MIVLKRGGESNVKENYRIPLPYWRCDTHTYQCVTFKTEEALRESIVDQWDKDKATDPYKDFADRYYEGTLRDGSKEQNNKVVEAAFRRSHLNTLKKVQQQVEEFNYCFYLIDLFEY